MVQAGDNGDVDLGDGSGGRETGRFEKHLGCQTCGTWRLVRCKNEGKWGGQEYVQISGLSD